ncbi:MAG: cyclophilin-like fold protein [Acidaminococcus sp.]|jgi:hypothetical protein|nr:cyclophilin-like fold protein [Acidaminococcus sp.]MCI2100280.1 cyclophilin-like fold protein [Acidaminococcus sp.]MCI2114601.1 cyclophilin-like fold protein [Acidaminococcus sp.]MCI2116577.1 cyclophilin-like fold protein [Acidaminococcus sp.]
MKSLKSFAGLLIVMVLVLVGCGAAVSKEGAAEKGSSASASDTGKDVKSMKIEVNDGTHKVVFSLNGSNASKSLLEQLPLSITVENYSSEEKIFYPKKLSTSGTPRSDAKAGKLAYYAPWGDVVMFYQDGPSGASGLYELGEAVEGKEQIKQLSGTITVKALSE